jgi:MtN3 and saliva related transmembrane protein
MFIDIIGYTAGALVIGSMIPQIIKSWKTKSTKDISVFRYIIYIFGIIFWMIYSFMIKSLPMMISNSVALIFAFSIFYLKLNYG